MNTAFTLYKNYASFQSVWQMQVSGFVPYIYCCHFGGKYAEETKKGHGVCGHAQG